MCTGTRAKGPYILKLNSVIGFIICLRFYNLPSPAFMAQLDTRPTGDQEVAGSTPAGSAGQHPFTEI